MLPYSKVLLTAFPFYRKLTFEAISVHADLDLYEINCTVLNNMKYSLAFS